MVGKFVLLTAVLDMPNNYTIGLCSSLVAILMIFYYFVRYIHTAQALIDKNSYYSARFSWEQTRPCLSPLSLLSRWLDTSWSPNQWHYKHQTLFCCLSWTSPNITFAQSHLWCVVQLTTFLVWNGQSCKSMRLTFCHFISLWPTCWTNSLDPHHCIAIWLIIS